MDDRTDKILVAGEAGAEKSIMRMFAAMVGSRPHRVFPRAFTKPTRTRYNGPHQGAREMARRVRQMKNHTHGL